VAPATLTVVRDAGCEGRRSTRRFWRPWVTNYSDLVASVVSYDDDVLQSFVLCIRLFVDPILEFFIIMMYDVVFMQLSITIYVVRCNTLNLGV
jgi:hypothetical protein